MKIISSYVREQQRYTKNQLRTMFSYDESGLQKFIKNLKSYGILKTVANSRKQRELTDLVDDDIEIIDETSGNDDCLYTFTYVGVITMGNRVIKVYPKYILSEKTPLIKMKQIVKVLQRYSHSEEQIVNLFNGDGDNRSLNILAVILYLLRDYFTYGVYNNTEDILEINGEGEIQWGRTIDNGFAIIEDNRPYYPELVTQKTIYDETDYFKRLHECVLTECSKQLHDAGLDDLFEMESVNLSEDTIEDFGDRDYILDRIMAELNIQFNTHRQITLKTVFTYISQDRKMLEENEGISMYGTNAFHAVWEKACADIFGNKLNVPIGQIKMSEPLANDYNPNTKLIDLIEKPKWCGIDTVKEPKDTLIPDLITITQHEGVDCFIIFDAKYYLLQLEKGYSLRGNPGVGDVTKQYLYQLAYKEFIKKHNIGIVKNCFLMPTEKNEVIVKGTAKMEMLLALGLEDIQIRQISATELFSYYLSRKRMPIEKLQLFN
ncbi:LlaJI family restriction endonuclease [uncultured Robinsoniella sp.]|uniref:LlaJI family restriction endonuclease n=1 Tax=uncultured Robinsoniella sp. TaxID=904190 RepID=UPI00374F2168